MASYILPLIVLFIVIYGITKKVNVYDTFIEGAKESFDMIIHMFPTVLGMILSVNLFVNSGLLNYLYDFVNKLSIDIPPQVLPLGIIRPISGSASLAIFNNILSTFGPDSLVGKMASVMQGSTDTTFYVITLYFSVVNIRKTKNTLLPCLLSDFIGFVASIILVKILL